MSRAWRRWLMAASGIAVVACADVNAPPAAAVQLAFMMPPSGATAGVAIDPVVAVAIQDAAGDLVPSATHVVTVAIETNPGGGTLAGTARVAAVRGIATFSDLHIDKAGAGYTLKAAATGLTSATSTPFTVAAAHATRLAFTVQPSNAMAGAAITPPVQLAAQDSFGNRATGFGDSVTVALVGNPAAGTLSGTTVARAIGGVATFSDLSIAPANAGYTLTASARALTGVASVPFSIAEPTATLRITASTSGSLPDRDGYAACIDPTSDGDGGIDWGGGISCGYGGSRAVGVNGTVTVTVDAGDHTVLLMGVAANCTVAGDNPRTARAAEGQTAAVPFAVTCAAATLHVTTTTTGASIDPDGYGLCVDPVWIPDPWDFGGGYTCTTNEAVGVNSGVSMLVGLGTHVLQLDGVAANCTVGDNPRTVAVGAATEVSFVITCVTAGAVRVTTATTGIDVPNGYAVCVDPPSCSKFAFVGPNDAVTIHDVITGPHTVTLLGVPGNCSISGATTRAVTIPLDGTVDVAYDVGCVVVERIAFSYDGTIVVSRVDGSDSHSITPGFAPAWSPDGARLAYQCGQDICAINADSTGFARLTVDAAANHHPTWAPDGSKIAFAATHAGMTDLYVMATNGSGVARLTQGVGFLGSPAWSPDGTSIAFDCRVDAGNDDLCSVNADGTGFARLTSDPARDYGAAWKPDGTTLAFATTRYGGDEIVLKGANSGSVTRIGAGLPGFDPTWSLDGTQLAFVVFFDGQDCFDWCSSNYLIFLATADGAAVRPLTNGDQPAWKPHP